MKIHNVKQQEEDWFKLKQQYFFSGTKAYTIANQGKGLETLCREIALQIYQQKEKERFSNEHTERGNTLEPKAIEAYEFLTGVSVDEIGFVTNEKISSVSGTSPDGWVGDNGAIEVKSHDDKIHFEKIIKKAETGIVPVEKQYLYQMEWNMLFGEREWIDFIAYNPNFKQNILIERFTPNAERIAEIKAGIEKGTKRVFELLEILEK